MKLPAWMKEHSLTDRNMADSLQCSVSAVRKYRSGFRIPRPAVMRRIEQITEGAVTPSDFILQSERAA